MRRRIFFATALPGALASCGFQPLYGAYQDGSIVDDFASIKILPIQNRSGQILRNYLLDGLTPRGEPERPTYRLRVTLIEPRATNLGISRTDAVVRYSYSTTAVFSLEDRSGNVLTRDGISSVSSYEVTNSEYATFASRGNAADRVLEDISHEMKARLAVWFRRRREQRATAQYP
jgi:LPS-assembly lipoprotein